LGGIAVGIDEVVAGTRPKSAVKRFERVAKFATVGGFGTVLNLAIMAALIHTGMHYVAASFVAIEVTIVTNFLLQERFVFRDHRDGGRSVWVRFASSLGFNNVEAAVKVPVVVALVELLSMNELLAQAVVLAAAFLLRFSFTSRFIYQVPLLVRPTK
jgi:dolichol-phosphate mannosyltransferase